MIFSLRLLTAWSLFVVPTLVVARPDAAPESRCPSLLVRLGFVTERARAFTMNDAGVRSLWVISRSGYDAPAGQRRSFLSTYTSARLASLAPEEKSIFWAYDYHLAGASYNGVPTDPRLIALLAHPEMKDSILQIVPEIHEVESKLLNLEHRGRIRGAANLPFAELTARYREAAIRGEWAFLHALPTEFVEAEIDRLVKLGKKIPNADRALAIRLLQASAGSFARYAAKQTGWFGFGRKIDWPIVSDDARALEDPNRRAVVALAHQWSAVDAHVAQALAHPKWKRAVASGRAQQVPREVNDPKGWMKAYRLAALEREWAQLALLTEAQRREQSFIVEQLGLSPQMTARLLTALRKSDLEFARYRKIRANRQRLKGNWILE